MVKRGLRGTKLVISDAHEGLKAAIRRVLGSMWQRCRVGLLKYSMLGWAAAVLGLVRSRGLSGISCGFGVLGGLLADRTSQQAE